MAGRTGLNHKVRGFKGVGWGRALPSAFGFDNCAQGDGVNDYLTVNTMNGLPCPANLTIECWVIPQASLSRQGLWSMSFDNNNGRTIATSVDANFQSVDSSLGFQTYMGASSVNFARGVNSVIGTKHHVVQLLDLVSRNMTTYVNGIATTFNIWTSLTGAFTTLGKLRMLFAVAGNIDNAYAHSAIKTDEFRIYKKALTQQQILLNYNNGIGANPFETEHLLAWYQFQEFENLDFSIAQDNSDIRLGIRDMSGKNNHAQPMNMDTNPVSPTYVLKPF